MFVTFISCTFVLILTVGRSTETKHVQLKEKLAKSLTHIKSMLVELNAKIEHERTLLSQINDNLIITDGPPVGRMNYDEVTDIWWKTSNTIASIQPDAATPYATQPAGIFSLSTLLPNEPTTGTGPAQPSALPLTHAQPLHTTTESPFIQDLKQTMAADGHNYFTAFLTRFMELIAIKDPAETLPVIHLLSKLVIDKLNNGIFDKKLAERLIMPIKFNMTTSELNEQASLAFLKLKNKDTMLPAEYVSAIDFYASLFTKKEDGELLFQALEGFAEYPKGQKTATQVSNKMLYAMSSPYMRIKAPVQPQRRSMNLEQSNKHISLKHTKLLETLIQTLKHVKHNKHHRFFKSYKQKPNKKYRKNRDEHLNKPEQTRRRAYVPSEKDYNHSEYFQNSIENDKLHKIREASSYSDETDQLRNNVHDALRHGNRTFQASRKSGGDVNNKQTVRALSTETDNEWVIKNNIYKVFEQEEGRFL